jgi:alanyl-tRNA synthetase
VGPSLEYFVDGLELGNCVFMQYAITDKGLKELDIKVIDMGAGQERFAWITDTKPMSYDSTFGPVAKYFLTKESIKQPPFLEEYVMGAGKIDFAETIGNDEEKIAKQIGIDYADMKKQLFPLQSTYAILDHLKTILFTSVDGMLPSNTGGGYNLRYILRRAFSLYEKNNFSVDLNTVLEKHIHYLKELYPELAESNVVYNVLDSELEKYKKSKEQNKSFLSGYISKKKKESNRITEQDINFLYESYGIVLEEVKELANKENVKMDVQELNLDKKQPTVAKEVDPLLSKVKAYDKTEKLYYEYFYMDSFDAKVLGIIDDYVILDKTAFYPEGGGQDCDLGIINDQKVSEVKMLNDVILHKVSDAKKIKKNSVAHCKIDHQRRISLSQHHTATHLLNGVCQQVLGKHIWQAGASKKVDIAHLDITHFKQITKYEIEEIEKKVNEYIQQDLVVKKGVLPRQQAEQKYGFRIYQGGAVPGKELRIIDVAGLDVEACGGTHLDRIGQIGYFKIVKRESVRDGVERIYFKAGISAVKYSLELQNVVDKASEMLKVPKNDVLIGLDKVLLDLKKNQRLVSVVDEREVETILNKLESEQKKKCISWANIHNSEIFLKLGIIAKKKFSAKFDILLIYSESLEHMNIIVNTDKYKKGAGYLAKEVSTKLGGKGGGSLDFAQVSGLKVDLKRLTGFLDSLLV